MIGQNSGTSLGKFLGNDNGLCKKIERHAKFMGRSRYSILLGNEISVGN
jgi:hypothetical protein